LPSIQRDIDLVCGGDTSVMQNYEVIAGPPPGA